MRWGVGTNGPFVTGNVPSPVTGLLLVIRFIVVVGPVALAVYVVWYYWWAVLLAALVVAYVVWLLRYLRRPTSHRGKHRYK